MEIQLGFCISDESISGATFRDHFFFCFLFSCLFFFFFLRPHLWHVEVCGLGVKSELQLQVSATATATPDPSRIGDLGHSLQQRTEQGQRWSPQP